jgi:hypothetical protein
VTFIEVVAKMLGAERAFETHTLPATLRVAPPVVPAFVPIPTDPEVPKMDAVFVIPVTFIEVVAKMLGAERAFETHTLPATLRVAPPVVPAFVPIPTDPEVPKMAAVFVIPVTFIEVVAKMLGAERAFETHTLPATLRVDPAPLVPTPTKPLGP